MDPGNRVKISAVWYVLLTSQGVRGAPPGIHPVSRVAPPNIQETKPPGVLPLESKKPNPQWLPPLVTKAPDPSEAAPPDIQEAD